MGGLVSALIHVKICIKDFITLFYSLSHWATLANFHPQQFWLWRILAVACGSVSWWICMFIFMHVCSCADVVPGVPVVVPQTLLLLFWSSETAGEHSPVCCQETRASLWRCEVKAFSSGERWPYIGCIKWVICSKYLIHSRGRCPTLTPPVVRPKLSLLHTSTATFTYTHPVVFSP